jgi:arginase family enzyme
LSVIKNHKREKEQQHEDSTYRPVNLFKPAGGLTPEEVQDAVRIIGQRFSIPGAAVTAYDPDADPERKGLQAGLDLITLLGEIGANQSKVS